MEVGEHCADNFEFESRVDEDVGLSGLRDYRLIREIPTQANPAWMGHPEFVGNIRSHYEIPGAPFKRILLERGFSRRILQGPHRRRSHRDDPSSRITRALNPLRRILGDLEPLLVQDVA